MQDHKSIMLFKTHAIKALKDEGLRITNARTVVLDILDQASKSLNAYEIANLCMRDGVKTDVTTVYRMLEVYKRLNLVHFVKETRGYLSCKKFSCENKEHCHHQFVCNKCKEIKEIHFNDRSFLETLKTQFAKLNIQNHYFEFSGFCESCNKNS